MKLLSILQVTAIALAALGLAATAEAVTTVNSSKSNQSSFLPINPNDPTATEKACLDKGGKIYTDPTGKKVCVPSGTAVTTVSSAKSNSSQFRTTGMTEAQCKAQGGTVLTDAAGGKVCVLPPPPPKPAS